jgi:hypothetical protein
LFLQFLILTAKPKIIPGNLATILCNNSWCLQEKMQRSRCYITPALSTFVL